MKSNNFEMNIQATKIELVKAILESESNDFLQKIADFVDSEKQESKDSVFSTTTDELKSRAESSLKSIEKGDVRNIDEFITEVENWKNRHAI